MCDMCDNQGGITVNRGWYAEFIPCPARDCDHDYKAAQDRNLAILRSLLEKCGETA